MNNEGGKLNISKYPASNRLKVSVSFIPERKKRQVSAVLQAVVLTLPVVGSSLQISLISNPHLLLN